MITVRPARPEELDLLWALVCRAVRHMNALGNPQWGADYPRRSDYAADLSRGELYAAVVDGVPAGAACINTAEAPEYAAVPWTTVPPAAVIHRMAVHPDLQGRGVGGALFAFAEAWARRGGLKSMRIDTYTLNRPMRSLIQRQGFVPAGNIRLRGRPLPFLCFEKALG